jgi:hypothetical protein
MVVNFLKVINRRMAQKSPRKHQKSQKSNISALKMRRFWPF